MAGAMKPSMDRTSPLAQAAGAEAANNVLWRGRWAAALSVLLLSSTAACSASMSDEAKPDNPSESQLGSQRDNPPVYRENPSPQHTRRLTMRIDNAPGEFGWVHGSMQFNVDNTECLPPPKDNPGGHASPVPMRMIPFELVRQPDGDYEATVFTDGMVDEDYHGRGVCHWKLLNVQVQLKATGAGNETLFMADMFDEELAAGREKTIYYTRNSYPRHPETKLEQPTSSGQPDRSKMASYLKDGDLFTITLIPQEAVKP